MLKQRSDTMLPYEKEVQKATKLYLLIINIGFALILLYAFITAATFFAIGQMHMNHVNPITLTGTPKLLQSPPL